MIHVPVRPHRVKAFKVLLGLTFFGGCGFFIINYYQDLILLAFLELIIGLVSLAIFWRLHNNSDLSNFNFLSTTYTIFFVGILLFAINQPGTSKNIYIWVLTVPLMAYLLLGATKGFLLTTVFMILASIQYISLIDYSAILESPALVANVICCVMVVWGMSHAYEAASEASHKKLHLLASVDHLTGLLNRTLLAKIFYSAREEGNSLALIMMDIDRFKSINDAHGHDIGDQVLKEFADMLKKIIADDHHAFRLGGEEFCVIMPDTSLNEATDTAEKIRNHVINHSHNKLGHSTHVTISCGVVASDSNEITFKELHAKADKRLFLAKSNGRNQVINAG